MGMATTIAELRSKSDNELIEEHDRQIEHVSLGVQFYIDELSRRETLRAMRAANRVALAAVLLSLVSAAASTIALFAR